MPERHENVVFGAGVINTGDNNQINNAVGDGNRQENLRHETHAGGPDRWEPLAKELARIRRQLADYHGEEVDAVDLDDAVRSVTAAEREIAGSPDRGQDARRTMRLRIKGLIGILAPVAEIIGGVAALETILAHL